MTTTTERKVPAAALRFLAPLTVGQVSQETGDKAPVSLLARTPGPVMHWFLGPVVHDLAGMAHKDKVAIDYAHGDTSIGYADQFTITDRGLELSGALVPYGDPSTDRAREVMAKSAAGVPYEASIDYSRIPPKLEEVPAGRMANVNGQDMPGPLLVVREWELCGVAICPHGVDAGTETRFADTMKDTVTVMIQQENATMAEETPKTQPETPPAPPAAEPPPAPPAPRQFNADEFARIEAKFGAAVAAETVKAGGDYHSACEMAYDRAQATIAELQAKLSAAGTGQPAGFVAKDDTKKVAFASLFESRK